MSATMVAPLFFLLRLWFHRSDRSADLRLRFPPQLIVFQRKVRFTNSDSLFLLQTGRTAATVTTAADLFITRSPYFSLNQAPPVRSSFG